MNHVHILVGEKIIYYACDDITSITYSGILRFNYDCSINTVTADILFPPELDPMTGEMTQMLPDVFNPDIPKSAVEKATPVVQKPDAKVEAGGVSTEPQPKVNSDLKISHLTKEQKEKYNQNRIRIRKKNNGWYAYIQKGVFSSKGLNKSDFFIITGYPEKAEIVKHNTQLIVKNYFLRALIFNLGMGIAIENIIGWAISYGGAGYFLYDYKVKKLEGASLNDAKIIAKKYNNDLIQRIFNEND